MFWFFFKLILNLIGNKFKKAMKDKQYKNEGPNHDGCDLEKGVQVQVSCGL